MALKKAFLGVVIGVSFFIPLAASAQSVNLSTQARQQLIVLAQQLVQILNELAAARTYGQTYLSSSAFAQQGTSWAMQILQIQQHVASILSSAVPYSANLYYPPTNNSTAGSWLLLEAEENETSNSVLLTTTFHAGSGCSEASYELEWGDGDDRTIDFDGSCSTQTRVFTHQYDSSGEYSITARNEATNNVVETNFAASAIGAAGAGQYNTVLFVRADSSISDNSTTGKWVSAHGNAAVSGTARVGSGSIFLDGAGDYISIDSDSDFNYGSGAFTISLWFRPQAFPGSGDQATLVTQANSGAADSSLGGAGLELYGNRLYFVGRIGGTTYHPYYNNSIGSSALNAGTWYHAAVVRSGNTVKLYLNGVSQGAISVSGSANASSNDLAIGRYGEYDGNYFNGFIDDVQVAKGVARWTGNFDPPAGTSSDTTANLLLHADGSDGSATFTDSSAANRTVNANGNVQVDTAQSKFGGGSALFDGASGYLSIADNADFEFGSGNFTIDMWVRSTSVSNSYALMRKGPASGYGSFLIYQSSSRSSPSSRWLFYATTADGAWNVCDSVDMGGVVLDTWTHLAVVRSGNTFTTYKDGVAQGTCTSAASLWDNSNTLTVGESGGVSFFAGYIDELRVSKGVARWTSNFTPPTASGQ